MKRLVSIEPINRVAAIVLSDERTANEDMAIAFRQSRDDDRDFNIMREIVWHRVRANNYSPTLCIDVASGE